MKQTQICQTIINQWQHDYQNLHDALSAEQLALEKRDFKLLSQASADKDSLVKQINQHQLPQLEDQQGMTINTLASFKMHCLSQSVLTEPWNELMQLVAQCRFKNEVNARLIELLNQSSKRTINLIKGFDPDNNIYNASGNRTAVRHYGSLISA
jgi:flagellar biosynthesis/type III secretory pathway chaperone